MSKRDLLFVGLRLIGIYLLIFGALDLLLKSATLTYNFQTIQKTLSEAIAKPVESDELVRSMVSQVRNVELGGRIIWDLIRILIGLYFCKGGKRVIDFLLGKEALNPPTNP